VDTPGAYNDAVAAGIEIADHSLIVSSLEMTSAKNTSLLLEALRSEGYADERTLVVANHTMRDTGFAPIQLARMLERRVWEVPFDPRMRAATQSGTPITGGSPNAPASLSLRALASRLAMEPDQIERRHSMRDSGRRTERFEPRRFTLPFQRRKVG
jgi:MinD-like ATPase involved in chromosome partitioning or flagellar assembly